MSVLISKGDITGGDCNGNGYVDQDDLFILVQDWLRKDGTYPGDLNLDEEVNIKDFSLMSKNWLKESVIANTLKLGIVTDIHNSYRTDVYGGRHYVDAENKAQQSVNQFVTTGVDAIFCLGDSVDSYTDAITGNPTKMEIIADILNNNSGGIPVYWAIGNHDCYTIYYDKNDWLADVGQAETYFYVDIENLRCVILDTGFSSSGASWPEGYNYTDAHICLDELNWLENTLEDADDRGMCSVLFSHYPMGACNTYHDLVNAEEVREIMVNHKVIALFSGHRHCYVHSTLLGNNSLGQPIHHIVLEGCVNGDFEEGYGAHFIVSVKDVGTLEKIEGYYSGSSMKCTTWTNGGAGNTSWNDPCNWSNGVPSDGDLVIFNDTSTTGPEDDLNQGNITLLELRIESEFTGSIGGGIVGNYLYINADTLTLKGGYSDSRIKGNFNTVNALEGNGTTQKILMGYAETTIGTLNMDMNNEDWQILFWCAGFVDSVNLSQGRIRANMGNYGDVVMTGGIFELSNSSDASTSLNSIDVQGGLFFTNGDNHSKSLGKLLIHGGDIDINGENLTVVDGIELYATPNSFFNKPDQLFDITVKENASLTFTLNGGSFSVTGAF